VFSASLAGDVLELPAGETQFALGVEHREESIATLDDGLARFGSLHLFRGQEPQNAELSVDEAYLEIVVPVLSGKSGFEQLDLEAAVRYSDYDTIGGTTATKLGFNWAINDEVRLRGSKATSVRAPNLSELFSPGVTTGSSLVDPCDVSQIDLGSRNRAANCAALGIPVGWVEPITGAKPVVTGGNPDLSEEKSDSLTIGAVITPEFVDNLTFSIDYWDIEITDAIGSFGVNDIVKKCVDSNTIANPFCEQVVRNPADSEIPYLLNQINVTKINVGSLNAKGIDFEGYYSKELFGGEFSATLNGSFLLEHEQLIDEGDPTTLFINRNNVDNPKFRSNLELRYRKGPLTLALNNRFIGSALLDPNALTNEAIDKNHVPSRLYNDFVVSYLLQDNLQISATITNLRDIDPPRRDDGAGGTVYLGTRGNYDNVGRFISLGVSYQF